MILKKEIGHRLQWSFIFCALLIFLIGIVCLYSWKKQNQQIRYALEDYIPKIQASIRLDENVNALFNEFNELAQATNTQSRLSLKAKINTRLTVLQQLLDKLPIERQAFFQDTINKVRTLLADVDHALSDYHVVLNKLSETQTYIYWLHNDFNQEINALLQDISLQQNFLLDQLKKEGKQDKIYTTLNSIHQELDVIASFAATENQIIGGIDQLMDKNSIQNLQNNLHYLHSLEQSSKEILLHSSSSMVTLRQIIQELYKISLTPNQLPSLLTDYETKLKQLNQTIVNKDNLLNIIKKNLEQQVNSDHWQLIYFSNKVQDASNLSISVIIITTFVAILFILIFNQFYIHPKITARLMVLNHSVIELSKGNLQTQIPVYGQDELGRIAELLRQSMARIHNQTLQLEAEIIERISIEKNLRETQNDLIQTAKLAMVGQTVTTLAHEINQPLNALSIYLYTAQVAAPKESEIGYAIEKSQQLIVRIKNIIMQLRTFSKRSDADEPLKVINVNQLIKHAWEIISLNKTVHVKLFTPDNIGMVLGNEIRYEQVFVNIFANAVDACDNKEAYVTIEKVESDTKLTLYIHDNGKGWPLDEADKLLIPFSTNKKIGLGIGLSLSQSIMQQNQGNLYIASTLSRHALIILEFIKPTDYTHSDQT
ncbi:ATP-binding protein [Orbaceae bacterium ESL0727]|nr:ATP-binding protein [Orbaceae bacterium ESL0727]